MYVSPVIYLCMYLYVYFLQPLQRRHLAEPLANVGTAHASAAPAISSTGSTSRRETRLVSRSSMSQMNLSSLSNFYSTIGNSIKTEYQVSKISVFVLGEGGGVTTNSFIRCFTSLYHIIQPTIDKLGITLFFPK